MYVLLSTLEDNVRFAPLYIHSFKLYAPHKILEATMMNQTYHTYEEITSIPDRLRWLRHSRGLMQREVARIAGVSRGVLRSICRSVSLRTCPGFMEYHPQIFWMNTTGSFMMDKPSES